MSNSVLDALEYHAQGWAVIPIRRGLKKLNIDWRNLTFTEEEIKDLFIDVNIGVKLGVQSNNLSDIDLDDMRAGIVARELMPDTLTFGRVGKPHSHRLYQLIDWSNKTIKYLDPLTHEMLVEFRGDGSYTIFPGSVHPSGELIEWSEDNIEILPAKITREQLRNYVALVASATLLAKYWPKGSRHMAALALAGWLVRNKMGADEIFSFVHAITTAARDEEQRERLSAVRTTVEKYSEGENVSGFPTLKEYFDERILRAVAKWLELNMRSTEEMSATNTTDEGNADRLINLFSDIIRYSAEEKKWYVWTGKIWEKDIRKRIDRLAAETAKSIYSEAASAATAAERAELAHWATQSNNIQRLEAMVKRASSRSEVVVSIHDWDNNPYLITVENGTYDLERDELLPFDKDHMITKMAKVKFEPDAPLPYLVHMAEQAIENKDTLRALQKGFGLALSGRTDKAIFFCYGDTNTGKTTLLTKGMQAMLGDYAKQISLETIAGGRERNKEMWIADMHGARYTLASEPPRNFVLDAAGIKAMTGDTTLKARALYEMPYDSVPIGTLFIDTNYRPDIPDSDDAIWNRIQLIYFRHKVKKLPGESGYIPNFDEKIKEPIEMAGLLNWCIEGYKLWQDEGLTKGEEMEEIKQEYREEQDTVMQFISDCIKYDENAYTEVTALWKRYEQWCRIQGIQTDTGKQSRNALSDVLSSVHKWTKDLIKRNGKVMRVWKGVELLSNDSENLQYGGQIDDTFRPYSE